MKVAVFPAADDACGRYRMHWPAKALQSQGLDVEIKDPHAKSKYVMAKSPFGPRVVDLVDEPDYDVAVFQRTTRRTVVEIMEVLQKKGVAVVVEVDDGISWLPLHNPARKSWDPFTSPDENWLWVEKACRMADWVTVTTKALADFYAPHGRVSILPNYVPKWYTEVPKTETSDRPVIGWAGMATTHAGDLRVAGDALMMAAAMVDARIRIVGPSEGVSERLPIKEVEITGFVDHVRYVTEMAKFDIGIAPLQMNRFNKQGKSWLKMLEMSAVGVPAIGSPSEDYLRLYGLGLGSIAETPSDWTTEITALALSPEWREERGQSARQYVKDNLTIENNAYKWAEAWNNAHSIRNGGLVDRVGPMVRA